MIGVGLALPLLLLVITGLPLQFTVPLGLGSSGVPFGWVHQAYGIAAPPSMRVSADVVQLGDQIFFGPQHVRVTEDLIGVLRIDALRIVVTGNEVMLNVDDPEIPLERGPLPGYAERVGIDDEGLLHLDTVDGTYTSDDLGASWWPAELARTNPTMNWAELEIATPGKAQALRFGAANLSWERFLQDLHSGRFFGPLGVWVMNLASLLFVVLGFTGLILWSSTRGKRRQ